MQLVEHIDRHVPKRGSGPSVGTYLLAAVLNRCLAPGSKASLARWFDSTALGRLLPLRSSQLTSQRFWDQMHRVPVSAIPAIERDIVTAMTREFGLDLRQVLFDAQCRTLLREIAKRRQHLRALQRQLRRWRDGKIRGGRKPGVATTRKKVDGWLRARHMRDLFDVQVREEDGLPKVNYRFQRRAWEQLQRRLLGKTLLFTDQAGWSDAELVRGYRAASCRERLPATEGQRLHRDPAAIPLDGSEDRGACVLLRAGADAVRTAAARTEPPRRVGLDPRAARRTGWDPRSRRTLSRAGGGRRSRTQDDALADDGRTAQDVRNPRPRKPGDPTPDAAP